jgi:hypothetical protein
MRHILLITSIFIGGYLYSQDLDYYIESEISYRQTGMLVLGSWAAANIAGGLVLRANTEGSTRYFHEMNAIWNTVNLGIAAAGYFTAAKLSADMTAIELMKEQSKMDKILLFNAGLDLAYIAGGFWLQERSRNTSNNPERLMGYGRSVVLQGAFLFTFDIAMVLLHQKVHLPESLIISLSPVPGMQLGLGWSF